ncbi:ABC-F family ATP-binding cassette domain-containing protein [Arthrobacter sp. Sa2CUA1]|uniref:ABC-F family ATP-binding cassette domain-containing protein n=1 Tax=Arthrobacter gallicola TaxID=2762225 RepID=A0ABR8UQH0_9MICC|nr:ABC-F family ATP-binding cassette domain-containing protein [Arthrobacter gallicola]MBD7994808.1 ABC-F family ATP-binding cassette domain-containing protein [Arthrobacter gallicola]
MAEQHLPAAHPRSVTAGHLRYLRLAAVTLRYPGRRLLSDVSLTVSPGQRTGLIGENGAGKSTLLRIAAGRLTPDSGSVYRPESVGFLQQEMASAPGLSVDRVLEAAVAPVRSLEADLAALAERLGTAPDDSTAAEAYDQVLQEAEHSGLWSLDARIAVVMDGLGLGTVPRSRPVSALSGGQRRRLSLAAVLLERPFALLLDEPTNHLDDGAVGFLVAELSTWPGPVLMTSHDRWFLDAAATGLVDLDSGSGPESYSGPSVQGIHYSGGYSEYLRARAGARSRWNEAWRAQEAERQRLQRIADVDGRTVFHTTAPKTEVRGARKFYSDKAAKTVGGRVQSARRGLAELERSAVPAPPPPLRFAGIPAFDGRPGSALSSEPEEILCLAETRVSGRLSPQTLVLRTGGRLLVEGANGAGKSTLLGLLAGTVAPDSGEVVRTAGLTVGMLHQEDRWPDLAVTAGEAYRSRLAEPGPAPSLAELGLLHPGEEEQRLGELSPGQRRRVALAVLLAEPPQLLLLDEPTNHLSLALAGELEQALADYPGTVVLASHDHWLRRRWTGSRLSLAAPDSQAG